MTMTFPPTKTGDPQALLINERKAAAMLGISPRLMWTLSDTGQIPFVRAGRRKLYSIETLRAWIRQQEADNAAPRS